MSENSLSFSWSEYQHCKNESVQVSYEFQLQRSTDYDIFQSGSEICTNISFNNLEAGTRYSLRVRVSVVSLTGTRLSSWSNYVHATTMPANDTIRPATTTEIQSSFAYRTTSVKADTTPSTTTPNHSSLLYRPTTSVKSATTPTTTLDSRSSLAYSDTSASVELETQLATPSRGMFCRPVY